MAPWKRTIRWLCYQHLVPIEQLVPDKNIFMWISHTSYVKLSLAVTAILVGGLKCRTQFWKGTTQRSILSGTSSSIRTKRWWNSHWSRWAITDSWEPLVCPLSVNHFIVGASIYGLWLTFWYLQTFLAENDCGWL
jgi:hypothetical protein